MEQRGKYIYKKIRCGSKVTSVYLGKKEDLKDYLYDLELQKENEDIKREKKKQLEKLADQASDLDKEINLIVGAILKCAGFHQHKGQWRLKKC